MSRRDTIIIAILVNAGLLMVLFATAMRSDTKKEKKAPLQGLAKVETQKQAKDPVLDLLDEPLDALAHGGAFTTQPEEIIFSNSLNDEELVLASALDDLSTVEPVPDEELTEKSINFVEIVVKKGDFLEKIAKSNGTTVAAIMTNNNMHSTSLKVGQVLKIPIKETASLLPKVGLSEEYYIVKDGDNPWLIATKNKVKWEDLLRLNNLDEHKARRLRPGDKLRLR